MLRREPARDCGGLGEDICIDKCLLACYTETSGGFMAKVQERTEPKQILKYCEALDLDSNILASCLAVNPKTIQRWHEGSAQPNEGGLRALEKLEAIYQLAARLLKKDALKLWFQAPNETLGGERPADLLSRGELDQVRNVLGMLEWGIYS